jgi:hypothetical protein
MKSNHSLINNSNHLMKIQESINYKIKMRILKKSSKKNRLFFNKSNKSKIQNSNKIIYISFLMTIFIFNIIRKLLFPLLGKNFDLIFRK